MLYLIEYCENYITKTLLESKILDDIDSYMKDRYGAYRYQDIRTGYVYSDESGKEWYEVTF